MGGAGVSAVEHKRVWVSVVRGERTDATVGDDRSRVQRVG